MNLTNNKKNWKLSLVTMERACGRCNQWAPRQTDRGGPERDCKTEGDALPTPERDIEHGWTEWPCSLPRTGPASTKDGPSD